MFKPLPTPAQMSSWDQGAVAMGLPEMLLMENASREALHVLSLYFPCPDNARPDDKRAGVKAATLAGLAGRTMLVFMGGGNNGGDAACLARHLCDAGGDVVVLHSKPLSASHGVAGRHLRLARRCGVRFIPATAWPERFQTTPKLAPWLCPDMVIDGLLGTGFSGQLRPKELNLVNAINALASKSFIFSLDIPSGLSGIAGRPSPIAVRARATVTFEAAKPGLVLPEARPYVGELHVRPIGIPDRVRAEHPASFLLLGADAAALLPLIDAAWHKGTAGRVLVAGGSPGLTGAPLLAARGALCNGAGLVTVTAPAALCFEIKAGCPDIMTLALPCDGNDTLWPTTVPDALRMALQRCDALALGPGLGEAPSTAAFVQSLLALPQRPPCVVDADALRALAHNPDLLCCLRRDDVLTPHPGEAGLLLGMTSAEVQADRFAALQKLQALAPSVWLLKGAGTLVGRRGEATVISPYAEPNLAVGGSGDVLSGCLAALLAQGLDPFHATCCAVLVHAEAGSLLALKYPQRGNTATDIANALPAAKAGLMRPSRAPLHLSPNCLCL